MEFKELPGISFTLLRKNDGRELTLEADGRVAADIRSGESVTIETSIPRQLHGSTWRCFTVDDSDTNRVPTLMRAIVIVDKGDIFQKNVPIQRTSTGQLVAYRQKNNFRILRLGDNSLDVFTVAVVVQNGVPWLTIDKTYHADISESTIFYPTDRPWLTLFSLVSSIRGKLIKHEAIVEQDLPSPADLDPLQGTVVWWDSSLAHAGMGSVMTNQGQMSVHWSQVKRSDSPRSFLRIGEQVFYQEIVPRNDGSGFSHQLKGVKPFVAY